MAAPAIATSATSATSAEPEFHPLANLFPLLEGAEFKALVEDIKKNGLREKIKLHEGKILDGRNRYRACKDSGFRKPEFEELPSSVAPLDYVISANLVRRHLNESQRALIAGKLVTTKLGDNQHRGGAITIQQAAKMLNVSDKMVKLGKAIEEAVPEVKAKVANGKLRLNAAKDIVALPKEQQEAELNRIEKARDDKAAAAKAAAKVAKPGQSKANQRMTDVDNFKKQWQGFDEMQRRVFVEAFKNEIAELLAKAEQELAMRGGG